MKVSVEVVSYDEGQDQYKIGFYDSFRGKVLCDVDAIILPLIIGCFGSPDELVGKVHEVTI